MGPRSQSRLCGGSGLVRAKWSGTKRVKMGALGSWLHPPGRRFNATGCFRGRTLNWLTGTEIVVCYNPHS